jgi:predicted RNA-binding Zn ribbon-like protein
MTSESVLPGKLPAQQFIGDHPALDLINTVVQIDGQPVDTWQSDADVLQWLARSDWLDGKELPVFRQSALLNAARALREAVRSLVWQRKEGKKVNVAALNAFLAQSRSHLELTAAKNGELHVTRRYQRSTPEQLLAPLAETAAELLETGNFDLVRCCESPECTLWFYDRTKSHRRRWCSMAVCGNRHKVSSFRQRQH